MFFVVLFRMIIYDYLGIIRYCLFMFFKLNKDLIEVYMESIRWVGRVENGLILKIVFVGMKVFLVNFWLL